MRKRVLVAIIAALLLSTVCGCGGSKGGGCAAQEEPAQQEQQTAPAPTPAPKKEARPAEISGNTISVYDDGTGTFIENSNLYKAPIVTCQNVRYTVQTGPMRYTVTGVQLSQIIFHGAEEAERVRVEADREYAQVLVEYEVENTVDEEMNFYPNHSVAVSNTKEQVDANLLLSDDIGGTYYGKVIKSGVVQHLFTSPASEINSVKINVGAPFTEEDWTTVGEDTSFEIVFNR